MKVRVSYWVKNELFERGMHLGESNDFESKVQFKSYSLPLENGNRERKDKIIIINFGMKVSLLCELTVLRNYFTMNTHPLV